MLYEWKKQLPSAAYSSIAAVIIVLLYAEIWDYSTAQSSDALN